MKKIFKLLFIAGFAIIALPLLMYAQDSTTALNNADTGILDILMGYLSTKWPIISTVGSILFLISEVLDGIPSIKANSVWRLVFGIIQQLFGKKTIIPILIIVGGSFFLLTSCHRKGVPQVPTVTQHDSTATNDTTFTRDTSFVIKGHQVDAAVQAALVANIPIADSNKSILLASGTEENLTDSLTDDNGTIHCKCKDDSLQERINWLTTHFRTQTDYRWSTNTVYQTTYKTTYKVPDWAWWLLWIDVAVVLYLIIKVVIYFVKPNIFKL